MATLMIITDGKELSKHTAATLKTYASVGVRLHVDAISGLYHAAKHGDPVHLNRLYAGLRSNDQTALKMYIRRVHAILGVDGADIDGLDTDVLQAAIENGTILGMKKGEFFIVKGHTTTEAKLLVDLCDKRFINPDGDVDRMVFDRNNLSEVKTLGDAEVLSQLITLSAKVDTTSEKTKVTVSDSVRKFLSGIRDQAEAMKNQTTLAEG